MGQSRGGLTTKFHAVTDDKGLPIRLAITLGQDHGATAADLLTELQDSQIVLGDKAYDANWIRQQIEDKGAAPTSRIAQTAGSDTASARPFTSSAT
jgi:transposase